MCSYRHKTHVCTYIIIVASVTVVHIIIESVDYKQGWPGHTHYNMYFFFNFEEKVKEHWD